MTLDLNAIPYADDDPPPGAAPTRVLTGLAAPRQRRTFLKAMAYGALTIGAGVLILPFLGRTRPAHAEVSPRGGLQGHDRADCTDAYPGGYQEAQDTHGIYRAEPDGACFGGTYMGWNWCNVDGWHRSGNNIPSAPAGWTWECSPRLATCAGKNSWRWTTPNRKVWRCSDGNSRVRQNVAGAQWSRIYLSICRARVA